MKKPFAIIAGLCVSAISSVAMADHPAFRYDFQRVREGADLIAGKTQAIVDAAAAQADLVRGGWIYHHVHGWRRHPVHGYRENPQRAWYREWARTAMLKLNASARHFAHQLHVRSALPHLLRDFRKLENRLLRARRVFAWLRPTAAMRGDMDDVNRAIAHLGPLARRLTMPALYPSALVAPPPPAPAPVPTVVYQPPPVPTTVYTTPGASVSWYRTY